MKKICRNKFITTWIAIFAILLSALAPSVSAALTTADARSPGWAEICSASNVYSAADKSGKNTGNPDSHEAKHCPFCLPHAGNFALPPALVPCCAVAAGHDAYPPLYYQAPSLLFSWVKANPRGPPQFS